MAAAPPPAFRGHASPARRVVGTRAAQVAAATRRRSPGSRRAGASGAGHAARSGRCRRDAGAAFAASGRATGSARLGRPRGIALRRDRRLARRADRNRHVTVALRPRKDALDERRVGGASTGRQIADHACVLSGGNTQSSIDLFRPRDKKFFSEYAEHVACWRDANSVAMLSRQRRSPLRIDLQSRTICRIFSEERNSWLANHHRSKHQAFGRQS